MRKNRKIQSDPVAEAMANMIEGISAVIVIVFGSAILLCW